MGARGAKPRATRSSKSTYAVAPKSKRPPTGTPTSVLLHTGARLCLGLAIATFVLGNLLVFGGVCGEALYVLLAKRLAGRAPVVTASLWMQGFSLLVLLPLSALVLFAVNNLTLAEFWQVIGSPRVLASFRLSFGAALVEIGRAHV